MFSEVNKPEDSQDISKSNGGIHTQSRDTVEANLLAIKAVLPELLGELEDYNAKGIPVMQMDEDLLGTNIWTQGADTLHARIPNDTYQAITLRVSSHTSGDTRIFLRAGVNDADFYSMAVDMSSGAAGELFLPSGSSLEPSSDWKFAEKVVEVLRQSVISTAQKLGRQDIASRL